MRALNKEILRLALPSILANLTVPLVGLVDIAVAGHLDSSAAALIGGISIGSLMFDMMYWNFGFLRAGTGGLTAQAYGREDWSGCLANLRHALAAALLSALILIAIQWPFQKLMFLFVQCSDEVRTLALKYFYIRIWAAPATLSLMTLRGWFIGMQDTLSSMVTDVTVNGVNILASIFLTLGIPGTFFNGIGFTGIAWGTFIAQYSGLLTAATIFLLKYYDVFRPAVGHGRVHSRFAAAECALSPTALPDAANKPDGKVELVKVLPESTRNDKATMRQFFSVNGDLFVRSLCLMGVYLAFSAISARLGDTLLAMSSIMMKLMMIFSYFTDGFAYAGEAMTGKYIGLGDRRSLVGTIRGTFAWSMAIAVLFIGINAVAGAPLLRMMTSDESVIAAAMPYLPWLVVMPLLGCPAFTWDGIFIGATASKDLRNSTLLCAVGFFAVWFGGSWLAETGLHLLMAAYFTHLAIRALYLTLRYKPAVLKSF